MVASNISTVMGFEDVDVTFDGTVLESVRFVLANAVIGVLSIFLMAGILMISGVGGITSGSVGVTSDDGETSLCVDGPTSGVG